MTHPDVIGYHESLAIILQDHGLLQNNVLRDHASSRASNEQATAIMEKIARDHPTVTRYQVFLARLISSLGVTYEVEHKLSLAKEAFSRSIGILEKFAAEHPQNMKIATTLGTAYRQMADAFSLQGDGQSALEWSGRAITVYRSAASRDPRIFQWVGRSFSEHSQPVLRR